MRNYLQPYKKGRAAMADYAEAEEPFECNQ